MTTYRVAHRRRWTSISNDLINDSTLSFRARGLLVWLLSKPDEWSIRSEVIAKEGTEGRDAVRKSLTELEEAGYIRRERVSDAGGKWSTVCSIFESPKTDFQASVNQSSDSQALSTNNGLANTDQQSSLREEGSAEPVARAREDVVASEYWDWYVQENPGVKPTIKFMALRSVAKNLLASGHAPDAIVDAMKTAKAWTAKALAAEIDRKRHEAESTATSVAIPHAVVKAFAQAHPFIDGRGVCVPRAGMEAVARAMKMGDLAVGEAMLRLAVVARQLNGSHLSTAGEIAQAIVYCEAVPRSSEQPTDYSDAMERAYQNRRWVWS